MGKKILIITGSPRKNGNSNAMAASFARAAEEKGCLVKCFDAAAANLSGCHGCETCYKTGRACSFDDDFNKVSEDILDADGIVFAMPVYWYSIPSQMKGIIDKFYAFQIGGKNIQGKKCAILSCCEENDMSDFEGVRVPLERTAAIFNWQIVGEVLIPGVKNEGDIQRTPGCIQAAALADKF